MEPTNRASGSPGSAETGKPKSSGRTFSTILILAVLAVLAYFVVTEGRQRGWFAGAGGKTPITVASFSPQGTVPEKTNLTLEFSGPLVPEREVDQVLEKAPVVIRPEIPGKFKWISQHKLRFYPEVPLRPATTYELEVLPEIVGNEPAYLRGDRKFRFNTEPLKVKNSRSEFVYERTVPVETRIQWVVEFNYKVQPKELARNIEVYSEYKGGREDLKFTVSPDNAASDRFEIVTDPIKRAGEEKTVRMKIAKGLRCEEGDLGLPEEYFASVNLETELKVYRVSVQQAEKKHYVQVEFSCPVDLAMAKEKIELAPARDFVLEQNDRYLKLRADFKTGETFRITIRKGLVGQDGTELKTDFSQNVYIQDLQPSVSFHSKGIFLPRKGSRRIAIDTVNMKKIRVEVDKIFLNNIVQFMQQYNPWGYWYYSGSLGRNVYSEEIAVDSKPNEVVTTPFDMGTFFDTGRKGIFRVVVRSSEEYWENNSLVVMATDLGLSANLAEDELFVWVNSLQSMAPLAGVEVTLWSRNNQNLGTGRTDRNGVCVLRNLKQVLAEEKFQPYLITAALGEDNSFLWFDDCRVPLSRFDVGGRNVLQWGYEAFLYNDRDIYRPDDTAHVAAIVRGQGLKVPEAFPLKLQVLDPTNRIFQEMTESLNAGGLIDFTFEVPAYAKTGGYTARLLAAEEEIGRTNFSVEDFIPDTVKVLVSTDKPAYSTGETIAATVTGQSLFGPPAAGRKVNAKVRIKAQPFRPPAWKGFTFGDASKAFEEMEVDGGESTLDEQGAHLFQLAIPAGIRPPAALKGVVSATVTEPGGRAVSAYKDVDIHPYPRYIGLMPKKAGYADVGQPYDVSYVVVDKDGQRADVETLAVRFSRVVYHTVLKQESNGRYHYVSEQSDETITSTSIRTAESDIIRVTPEDYGCYKVEVSDPAGGAVSTLRFYASGWGYAPWSMENPDRVDLELDKPAYKVGETAKVLIKAPFGGRLLLTTEREKVLDYRVMTMEGNTATVEIPVKESFIPNVYVAAAVIKSIESFDGKSPLRAFGVAPLAVDATAKKVAVRVTAPEAIRPRTKLTCKVNIENMRGATTLTVAAVDEGICQLTDFKTPDPFEFFYGKKRLGVDYSDIYSFILPEVKEQASGQPAGDYLEKVRKKHLSPIGIRRVEPVSFWSGIVKTGADGSAEVSFDVPQFQGRLRVMAVAANGAYAGSARTDVYVRDKIVLTPTFPRFVTAKDAFTVPVPVYNGTGKEAEFTVALKIEGPVSVVGPAKKSLAIPNEKEKLLYFDCKVGDAVGGVKFTVEAEGGGEKTFSTVNVPIGPSSPVVTKTGSGSSKDGAPYTAGLPGGFLEGTAGARLILSTMPTVRFAKSLQYLLRYPHGCLEQTTSRVFPLLYFDALAKLAEPQLFGSKSAAYYVDEGIQKIVSMQQDDGSFTYWPGWSGTNYWSSIYACHFLVEARKAGYAVPDRTYTKMLSFLEKVTRDEYKNRQGLQAQVYACFVLSLAGEPPRATIRYIKENLLDKLSVASRYQLALCFALSGDLRAAQAMLPTEVQPAVVERQTGGNFDSSVRENAIMLEVLAEIFPESPGIPVLVKELGRTAEVNEWYTTQDNAFALLAMGKVMKSQVEAKFKGELRLDDNVYATFDEKGIEIEKPKIAGKKVSVSIQGSGQCYAYWQVWGVPVGGRFDEYDKGIRVSREYLGLDGKSVDLNALRQGQLVVARIRMEALVKDLENVIVDDMLPAGLEIENPRLESRAEIPWIEKASYKPDYVDMRDDRLLLYTPLKVRKPVTFYYGLRAVTRGDFRLPPVSAECMYDPSYTSVESSGMIKVIE